MDSRATHRLARLLCLDDFETAARRHLPRCIFGYVAGAAETDWSLRDNRQAFAEFGFLPRVLVDVSKRSTAASLFGQTYAAPFGIAPLGISALYAYRGDIVLATAAAEANVPMIMSGSSLIRLEEVASRSKAAWFQAYLPGDVPRIVDLIARVAQAGFETVVITVDSQVAGNRENNIRAGFSTPLRPSLRLAWDGVTHPRWLFGTFLRTLLRHGMPYFENNDATRGPPIISQNILRDFSDRGHLTWEHLRLVRRLWKGRLVVKGILDTQDAKTARDAGADGIIVSNHGGRQLDGAVSALRVLADIADTCPDIPVMMDGGIRRGTDVLKALALGARFVFVGRPFGYAAAIAGIEGVRHAIGLLATELSRDMAILGITDLQDLDAGRLLGLPRRAREPRNADGNDGNRLDVDRAHDTAQGLQGREQEIRPEDELGIERDVLRARIGALVEAAADEHSARSGVARERRGEITLDERAGGPLAQHRDSASAGRGWAPAPRASAEPHTRLTWPPCRAAYSESPDRRNPRTRPCRSAPWRATSPRLPCSARASAFACAVARRTSRNTAFPTPGPGPRCCGR